VENYGTARQATDENVMRRRKDAILCRKTKAGIEIHIDFPRQQLLRERASILRYTYIASLFIIIVVRAKSENPRSNRYSPDIVFVR
jgi:hypothetical protein